MAQEPCCWRPNLGVISRSNTVMAHTFLPNQQRMILQISAVGSLAFERFADPLVQGVATTTSHADYHVTFGDMFFDGFF